MKEEIWQHLELAAKSLIVAFVSAFSITFTVCLCAALFISVNDRAIRACFCFWAFLAGMGGRDWALRVLNRVLFPEKKR